MALVAEAPEQAFSAQQAHPKLLRADAHPFSVCPEPDVAPSTVLIMDCTGIIKKRPGSPNDPLCGTEWPAKGAEDRRASVSVFRQRSLTVAVAVTGPDNARTLLNGLDIPYCVVESIEKREAARAGPTAIVVVLLFLLPSILSTGRHTLFLAHALPGRALPPLRSEPPPGSSPPLEKYFDVVRFVLQKALSPAPPLLLVALVSFSPPSALARRENSDFNATASLRRHYRRRPLCDCCSSLPSPSPSSTLCPRCVTESPLLRLVAQVHATVTIISSG
ncbi:hypothetical protein FDECE_16338, partial [Fusarium decemcellulare]